MMTTQPDWSIIIKRAQNGFITQNLQELIGEGDPTYRKDRFVFEEKGQGVDHDSERKAELEAFRDLTYHLMEYFGIHRDKYSYNLDIKIIKDEDEE